MIIKVTGDADILADVVCSSRDLVWTLGASQAFLVSIPALKRLLGIITVTSGFTEHGYDLYTVKHTPEGLSPDRAIDVTQTPDQYAIRSGHWIYVRRLKVSQLSVVLTRSTIKCGQAFEVMVRASDYRGNPRPLGVGGLVVISLRRGAQDEAKGTLKGQLTQGSGDGRQVEFLFPSLSLEVSGKYVIHADYIHPTGNPASAPAIEHGATDQLTVEADPHPVVKGMTLTHVGRYGIQLDFYSSCAGHLCYLVFRDADGGFGGLTAGDVHSLAMRGIALERKKGALTCQERAVDKGEGAGTYPNCIAAGVVKVSPGQQAYQILLRLHLGGAYRVLMMSDNAAGTNPRPEVLSYVVQTAEHPPNIPVLSNVSVECTAGGRGGVKVTFDCMESGHAYYVVTLENVYHPVEGREVIEDARHENEVANVVARGSFVVGRGLGHSAFLEVAGLQAGVVYDFWWATHPVAHIRGVHANYPDEAELLKSLPPPQRATVLVPHEDPPTVSSFCVLAVPEERVERFKHLSVIGGLGVGVDNADGSPDIEVERVERRQIRVHFESDCPGSVHFIMAVKGRVRGDLIPPSHILRYARHGLDPAKWKAAETPVRRVDEDEDAAAREARAALVVEGSASHLVVPEGSIAGAGSFPALASGHHTFVISHPTPKELDGYQHTLPLLPEVEYELFFLSDNCGMTNPSSYVTRGHTVTIPRSETVDVTFKGERREGEGEEEEEDTDVEDITDLFAGIKRVVRNKAALQKDKARILREDDMDSTDSTALTEVEEADAFIARFKEAEWASDLRGLHSLLTHDTEVGVSLGAAGGGTTLPYRNAQAVHEALFNDSPTSSPSRLNVEHEFVYLQQRLLDLETTVSACRTELDAATTEENQFATRLPKLLKDLRTQKRFKKDLLEWKAQHLNLAREALQRECRDLQREVDEVIQGNLEWEAQVAEVKEVNDHLSGVALKLAGRRDRYIRALQERCVRHKTDMKNTPDQTDAVLLLRRVKDEQSLQLHKLREIMDYFEPPEPVEVFREKKFQSFPDLLEPEQLIVSRRVTVPKGGLRALATVDGTGLQALRYKHNVTAEIMSLTQDNNELEVTGEKDNVLAMLKEVEQIYETMKLLIPGPQRIVEP